MREFIQQLHNHYLTFCDNIFYFTSSFRVFFCRFVIAQWFTKKAFYIDDEDVISQLLICITLNEINLTAQKEAILACILFLKLIKIWVMDWKPENYSFEYYKKEKPKFLFGLLTVPFWILRHYLNYKKNSE